ncbi:MAG: acyl carrier protein [Coriobacteriales bacterium]|jgi:D-alanine--poly(phosphoribitol) ligase subunit 2
MEPTLEEVIELLQDVEEDVDYETCTTLVDDRVLDSFDIISIINAIDEEFDVAVPAKDIVPDNFNSASAIHALILRLQEED